MKAKKFLALLLAVAMILSFAACTPAAEGEGEGEAAGGKLVVWTWTKDLQTFADKFTEETGIETEVILVDGTDNYSIKVATALGARSSEVDIIAGEPQMVDAYYEGGFLMDLSTFATAGQFDQIVDFVVDVGTDDDGVVRMLSYQMTPGSIIYRRDLANEVFGTEDPAEIAKLFADYNKIIETAKTLREHGYYIFASTSDLGRYSSAGESWIVDGNKVNLSESRLAYLDAAAAMYTENLTANAAEWSGSWYASMGGEIPEGLATVENIWDVSDEEKAALIDANGVTQVFAYSLPTWGALMVRDNATDVTSGKFGVCSGPCSYTQGGTWVGINAYSKNAENAWKFVEFVTLNEETSQWWIETSGGDVVSNKACLEANADFENPAFGGQKTYEFYLNEAATIDYSIYTIYDQDLNTNFATAISNVQTGVMTRDEAIEDFKTTVAAIHPELVF